MESIDFSIAIVGFLSGWCGAEDLMWSTSMCLVVAWKIGLNVKASAPKLSHQRRRGAVRGICNSLKNN